MSNRNDAEKTQLQLQSHSKEERGGDAEEEEEEALSLCDLPLLTTHHQQKEDSDSTANPTTPPKEEDFDFGSLAASLDTLGAEMCSADEVFFDGRILPFRHSVSINSSSRPSVIIRSPSQPILRTGTCSGFQSSSYNSSRSSSTNSSSSFSNRPMVQQGNNHSTVVVNSPELGDSNNNNDQNTSTRFQSYFQSCPTPKPYIRTGSSGALPSVSGTSSSAKKSSALWEIFRVGLARTPEIDLEGLKSRYGKFNNKINGTEKAEIISRNSSSNSGGSSSSCCDGSVRSLILGNSRAKSVNNGGNHGNLGSVLSARTGDKQRGKRMRRLLQGRDAVGISLINSCKCSVGAIEPESTINAATKEEEKRAKETKKQVVSHDRAFEWLRNPSIVGVLNNF